jgi:drug/metabolite transporter (DMT)-like permease
MGSVPLLTFLLVVTQRLERFHVRGLLGASLAILGIAVISARPPEESLPILPMLAVLGAAATAAEAAIVIRKIPAGHPLTVNAVGMAVGGVLLFATSVLAGETRQLPESGKVWAALAVMVAASPLLFVLFVFVVQRWSASAAAYQIALFPLVSIVLAAILLDEPISSSMLIGAPLVLLGVHVGAISRERPSGEGRSGEPSTGEDSRAHEAVEGG